MGNKKTGLGSVIVQRFPLSLQSLCEKYHCSPLELLDLPIVAAKFRQFYIVLNPEEAEEETKAALAAKQKFGWFFPNDSVAEKKNGHKQFAKGKADIKKWMVDRLPDEIFFDREAKRENPRESPSRSIGMEGSSGKTSGRHSDSNKLTIIAAAKRLKTKNNSQWCPPYKSRSGIDFSAIAAELRRKPEDYGMMMKVTPHGRILARGNSQRRVERVVKDAFSSGELKP